MFPPGRVGIGIRIYGHIDRRPGQRKGRMEVSFKVEVEELVIGIQK
jgi:hypothetical protein